MPKKAKKPFKPRHQREVMDAIEEQMSLPYSILVLRERYGTPQKWVYVAVILEYCLAGHGGTKAAAIRQVKEMLLGQHLLQREHSDKLSHRTICTARFEDWHDYNWLRQMRKDA